MPTNQTKRNFLLWLQDSKSIKDIRTSSELPQIIIRPIQGNCRKEAKNKLIDYCRSENSAAIISYNHSTVTKIEWKYNDKNAELKRI